MSKVKRYVIGYDLHYPKVDKTTLGLMLQAIKDIQPDGFVFGGDQFDNEEISHHNSHKPFYKERRSYKRNEEKFIVDILDPLNSALPKACEKTWIIGNHDDWEFQFVEGHPEFEGLINRVESLHLEKRGWEIIPLGYAKRVGELNIIHGEVLTGIGNQAGLYPSRKAVEIYGSNVLAGHTHAPQSFSKISPVEVRKKHMGWIAPILGATNPTYLKNRPTAWLNGFVVLEVYGRGLFNLYTVIVNEGKCAYAGKLYEL